MATEVEALMLLAGGASYGVRSWMEKLEAGDGSGEWLRETVEIVVTPA